MELLDRYLHAVEFWLPKSQKNDIIAELSEDIRSEIEEKEAGLGRALNEVELETILQRRGDPLRVAESYLPQQHLIGPTIYPVYAMLTRGFALYFVLPWLVIWACFVSFAPSYRANHPGMALVATLGPLWSLVANSLIGLTLGFAIAERYKARKWVESTWSPRQLPTVRDPNAIPISSAVANLASMTLVALWWRGRVRLPAIGDLHITLSSVLQRVFYWPIFLVILAIIGLSAVNVFFARWTPRRAAVALAIDSCALIVSCGLLAIWARGGSFVEVSGGNLSPEAVAAARKWVTFGWGIIVAPMALSYVARVVHDARRAWGRAPISNRVLRLLMGE
jgi:hypothetical protein